MIDQVLQLGAMEPSSFDLILLAGLSGIYAILLKQSADLGKIKQFLKDKLKADL